MIVYEKFAQNARTFLAMTGYPLEEFHPFLPYFQAAFETWVNAFTFQGDSREKRAYRPDTTCPLPTMDAKWVFLLADLNQQPTQARPGCLLGMPQPVAKTWIHR